MGLKMISGLKSKSWFVFGITLSLLSCENGLQKISGTYVGDYSRIENDHIEAYRVRTQIGDVDMSTDSFRAVITDENNKQNIGTISVERQGSKVILKSPLLAGKDEIELVSRGVCAEAAVAQEGQIPNVIVCAQNDTISLFSTDPSGKYRVLLYLHKEGTDDVGTQECQPDRDTKVGKDDKNGKGDRDGQIGPINQVGKDGQAGIQVGGNDKDGAVGLSDLFHYVLSTDYETRIAAEKLYQAQEQVKVVRSELLPPLSLGGLITLIQYPLSPLGIGSLVPFIFPSNWFALDRSKALYQAEAMSYRELVANQMNLTEDLYHSILRDERLVDALKRMRDMLIKRRELVKMRVDMGYCADMDLVELDDLIYKNQTTLSALEHCVITQNAILLRSMGIPPRCGKTTLRDAGWLDVYSLGHLESSTLMAEALSGSMELKQVLFLENAAASEEKEVEWSFLNPCDWISFNIAIIHKVRIAKSSLREVQLLKQETEYRVEERVVSLAANYNQLLDQNLLVEQNLKTKRLALEVIEQKYENGILSILQLKAALEGIISLEVDRINAQSSLAIVIGKLNRLLWKESYVRAFNLEVPKSKL